MPRVSDSKNMGTQLYHSHFCSPPYEAPNITVNSNGSSHHHQLQSSSDASSKKKHICATCDRAFTTSGHLARHSRVHTGERNHKCPFPGCETRCSRQDNLQQHYRIHLSPGSRRSSTRSAIAKAMSNNAQTSSTGYSKRPAESALMASSAPPPLSAPPALAPANRTYAISTPPQSPPALAQATLPATAHHPSESSSSRSSSSPNTPYSPISHTQLVPMTNGNGHSHAYSQYRSGTTTYQEQSRGAGFTYVHTTPISSPTSSGNINGQTLHSSFSYANSHNYENMSHNHSPHHTPSPPTPLSSISSRHSISHISHPQSYPNHQNQSPGGPPSPESTASVASHTSHNTSGPTTPYTGYNEESHYGVVLEPSPELSGLGGGHHVNSHGELMPNGYTSSMMQPTNMPNRFDSPPPILAPIQGDRNGARGDQRIPYLQHPPQPISNDYQYQQSHIGSSHGAWKSASGLRSKGIGALVQ